jgi:hypothetical protein
VSFSIAEIVGCGILVLRADSHCVSPCNSRTIRTAHPQADIAKRAGTSRMWGTAIANGNIQGVSTNALIRVRAATGHRTEIRVKKTAA